MTAFLTRWRTALAAGLVLATVFGVIEGFSIFYSAFVVDLGLDRAQASGMFAVYLLSSTVVAPLAGHVVGRHGPRRVITAAFPIFALGVAACAWPTALWQFYALYMLVLAGATTMLVVSSQVLITSGYEEDRGRATGIAYACLGVGNFVLFSFLALVVERFGWRVGYLAAGGLAAVGATAFLYLGRCGPPAAPATETTPTSDGTADIPPTGQARGWLLSRPVLWLVCGAALTASVTDFFTFQTIVPYLTSEGRGVALSGFLLGLTGLSYSAGQLLGGTLSDRTSRELAGILGAAVFITGLALLWALPPLPLLVVAITLLGASVGVIIGCRVAATGDLFNGTDLSRATGAVQVASAVGSAFATWFGGFSYSVNGDYGMSFLVAGCCAVGWVAALWFAAPRRVRAEQAPLPATPRTRPAQSGG